MSQQISFEDLNSVPDTGPPTPLDEVEAPHEGEDDRKPWERVAALPEEEPEEEEALEAEPEEEEDEPEPPRYHQDPVLQQQLADVIANNERMTKRLEELTQEASAAKRNEQTAGLQAKIDAAKVSLRAAIEAADVDAQADAQAQIAVHAGNLHALKQQQQQPAAPPPPPRQAQALPPKAAKYKERNPWIGDTRNPQANAVLQAIDISLTNEGYDFNSDDYYTEMSRRLRAASKARNLGVVVQDMKPVKRKTTRQGAADDQTAGNRRAPVKRKTLTAQDRQAMLMVNMDPNNKVQAEAFLRERLAREALEARRQR